MEYEVTIGIPVYNVEKYIRKTLESALAQTFSSIDFLVLDDCGTDASMDIVRDMQSSHPRGGDIRIVSQPHNMGIGHGRNRIIDEAKGHYLFFLDSDDYLPPRAIEVLYEAIQKYHAKIAYGSNERIEEYGEEQKIINCKYESMQFLHENEFANYAYEQYGNIPANVWKFLIDIRVYRDNKLRFPIINFWEDFCMTIDLPTYIDRAVFLPDITYCYYSRIGTLSNNQKRDRISKQEIIDIAKAVDELKKNGERIKNKPYYLKRCFKVMMTEFYMVCYILQHKDIIFPAFSNKELREMMHSPLSFFSLLGWNKWKIKNLVFCILGNIPSVLCVGIVKLLGKTKGLV